MRICPVLFSVAPSLCSRLQNGVIDLKDAIKWQLSPLIISRTGGTAELVSTACDFGFLLTFVSDIPDEEYGLIVGTLPRSEQALARRTPGDFSMPSSNNPSMREFKQDGVGAFRKRGKKNPKQDVMGQKTVLEALPRIKPEQWNKMDLFKPMQAKLAAAQTATPAAAAAATSSPTTPTIVPAVDATAMDTSSSVSVAQHSTLHIPSSFPLPLTVLVPVPTLLLSAHREPILVCGHYRKFYRFLSQSVWKLGDTKMLGHGAERNKADAKAQAKQGAAAAAAAGALDDDPPSDPSDDERDEEAENEDEEDGDDDDEEGRRMTDSSVEEEIVRMLLAEFQAREYKFHSSGREDMDVRMLGNGRQFFIEFIEAKKVPKSVGDQAASITAVRPVLGRTRCMRTG
jgi:hypothetical protein